MTFLLKQHEYHNCKNSPLVSLSRLKHICTDRKTENCCHLCLYYYYSDWCFAAQTYTTIIKLDVLFCFFLIYQPKCTSLATSWIFWYRLMCAELDIWAIGNWTPLSEKHQTNSTLETLKGVQYPMWLWLYLKICSCQCLLLCV